MEEWQEGKSLLECNSYMLKYEVATDVTFHVGQEKEVFRAHRYALMSRSVVFLETLSSYTEVANVTISLSDLRPEVFREVLSYIYTGSIDIHGSNVTAVMFAAKRFGLQGLISHCFKYLDGELSVNNVCKIMEQAHKFSMKMLHEKCLNFALEYGAEILKTHGFFDLCSECVRVIVKDDDLKAEEEDIYEGVLTWATHECRRNQIQATDTNRRKILGDLLYYVRFTTMDVTYYTQRVSKREILPNDEAVAIFQYFHGEDSRLPSKLQRGERNRLPIKTVPKDEKQATRITMRSSDFAESPITNRPPQDFLQLDRDRHRSHLPRYPQSRSPNYLVVSRFRTYDGQWKQNGPPDAITFSCSRPIALYGVEIFGSAKGSETYRFKIYLLDDMKEEVMKKDGEVITDSIQRTYEVTFPRPVRVPPHRFFTIVLVMKGSPTVKGVDGTNTHVVNTVTFQFINSSRSSNGTDVTVGQIPSILFTRTE